MISPTPGIATAPLPSALDRGRNLRWLVVEDATGFRLAYVYCKDENDRGMTTGYLKPDEARRIAKGIARLPELMGAPG